MLYDLLFCLELVCLRLLLAKAGFLSSRSSKTLNVSSGVFRVNQSITKTINPSISGKSFSSASDSKVLDKSLAQTPKHTVQVMGVLLWICMWYCIPYMSKKEYLINFCTYFARCLMNMGRTSLLTRYIIQILGFYSLNKEKYSLHMIRHGLPWQTFPR